MKIATGEFIRSAVAEKDLIHDERPQIAFAGRSNVGKSSLLNRLLGRRNLARISRTPGRTQAINYFLVGSRIYFVDLPGYGYAKVAKQKRKAWAKLMESYFRTTDARVVQLVDAKVGATVLDVEAHEYLASVGRPPLVVATKIDRVPSSKRARQLESIRRALSVPEQIPIVPFSAPTGEGVGELWKAITAVLETRSAEWPSIEWPAN